MSLRDYVATLHNVPFENRCVPMPLFSLVNGGKAASNPLFMQEILLIPTSATSFAHALHLAGEFTIALRRQFEIRGLGHSNRGVLGGFTPQLETVNEVFQVLHAAVEDVRARIETEETVSPLKLDFGVDFAASEYAEEGGNDLNEDETSGMLFTYTPDRWVAGSTGAIKRSSNEMLEMIRTNIKELKLLTLIDPFDARDTKSFTALYSALNDLNSGDRVQIVRRIAGVERNGVEEKKNDAWNTVLLSVYHFSTVSRLLQAISEAHGLGLGIILEISSGHNAALLAALAVSTGVRQVKFRHVLDAASLLFESQDPNAPPYRQ